ncbi:MAG: putative TrmH family tRNA/rRNA methyltransferase [Chlamydiota bacterium]
MGPHAVQETLLHAPSKIITLYIASEGKRLSDLEELATRHSIAVCKVRPDLLDHMTGTDSHGSVAAHVRGRKYYSADEYLEGLDPEANALVVMVDQIFDPQNFGAILRAAECLGASGVIWSKNRGVDLTPAVAKASSGASELIPLIRISNLADTAERFKKAGFEVIATLADPHSQPLFQFTFAPRTLLILGSEGEGVQPLLRKKADRSLYIPMQGKIQSLNVSQAAAILLATYAAQKNRP